MERSKSSLAALFLMGFISASSAYVFTVGGRIGWVENPPVPYSSWSGSMRFSVNDTLVFNNKQGDSVLLVKKESYDSCNVTNPLQKLDNGVYKLDHSGPHYFISGAASHCNNGEKLLVVVLAIRNPPSPPALAPPAPVVSPTPSSLSPSPSPASVTAPTPAPSSLPPSQSPASVTAPAPAPSSLSPSQSPASVTAPAPAPSSLSPSTSPISVPAPSPAPSSLSPSTSPISVPAPGPSSVSPASSSSPLSPSPGSVPVKSPPEPGSAPSGSPAPPPSTNSSPVLRMSFGLVALVIGCTLMI